MRFRNYIIVLLASILLIMSGCTSKEPEPKTIDDVLVEKYIEQMEIVFSAQDEFDKAVDNTATTQDELLEKMNRYVEAKRKLNVLEKQVLPEE